MPKRRRDPSLPRKIYPSQMPGHVHSCTARGMQRISLWIDVDRKERIVQYCKMKKVTMTDLFMRAVNKELSSNFENEYAKWSFRRRHIRRAKAYRYLLSRLKSTYLVDTDLK